MKASKREYLVVHPENAGTLPLENSRGASLRTGNSFATAAGCEREEVPIRGTAPASGSPTGLLPKCKKYASAKRLYRAMYGPLPLSVLSLLIALIATRNLQLNMDSFYYIDAARTVLTEGHYATYLLTTGSQQVPDPALFWPPLFPLLLSAGKISGLSFLTAGRLISVVSFVAVLALFWVLARQWVSRAWASVLALVWLAVLLQQDFWWYVMSDPLFILSVEAFLVATFAAERRCWRRPHLFGLGMIAAAASLLRHMGLSLVVALLAYLVILSVRQRRVGEGALRCGIFMLGFGLLYAPYLTNNLLTCGTLLPNPRPVLQGALADETYRVVRSVLKDLVPAFLVLGPWLLLQRWKSVREIWSDSGLAGNPRRFGVLWMALYWGILVITATRAVVSVYTRTCSPAYPVAFLAMASLVRTSALRRWNWRRVPSVRALTVVYVGLLFIPVEMALTNTRTPGSEQHIKTEREEVTAMLSRRAHAGDLILAGGFDHLRLYLDASVLIQVGSEDQARGFLERHGSVFNNIYLVRDMCSTETGTASQETVWLYASRTWRLREQTKCYQIYESQFASQGRTTISEGKVLEQ
jgi:hypothetical protein